MRLRIALIAITAAVAARADWPQFRGNPSLTGVATQPVPQNLKLLWTYQAGDSIESSAAVADGVVYVGNQAGELHAVNLSDGKLRWKYKTKEAIAESSPAVANGIVVVGDLAGYVHGVNAKDGTGVWTYQTGTEVKSSPVIAGDRVIIGSYDGNLYCLSLKDGKLLWRFKTKGQVHATSAIASGLAFISGCDGVLRAIRISDGAQAYEIMTGSYTGASPALSLSKTAEYAFFGTFDNDVHGYNLRTRKLMWRYENKARQFPFYSSAAIADGKAVMGGRDKYLHCLEQKTGKELWSFATRARVESSPAIADHRVFVGSNDGRFYVLDLNDGKKIWDYLVGEPMSASPALSDGRIVIGTQDGKLLCFGE